MTDKSYADEVPATQTSMADSLAVITASLVGGHDSSDVLRLVTSAGQDLLGSAATGVMVVDPRGGLEVVAASDERARFVELLQSHTKEGPCPDCIRSGEIVQVDDITEHRRRWPEFTEAARKAGYLAVLAVPMKLGDRTVGGLNLLHTTVTKPASWQLRLAQTLADLVVLSLSQERDLRRSSRLAEQTLTALNDRVLVAHAVGLIAGTLDIDPHQARTALAAYAVGQGRPAPEIARAIAEGELAPEELTVPARAD
ncbi:GAF domain-containing protein [Amycolatopsis marina]|uniref:GAF domain-containing protein n=1 Tax=Amycolatopsis marina TaxID=490629 RepID=A0A1I0Z5N1_9PSEU|nr:GAF and ANTAR domain-containing protein [Amycolatopsis marina]SFB19900.1 GAF domain-containing protein [Amycolatopsis marina]